MDVQERIQVLVESANAILEVYHAEIKKDTNTTELRHLMSSNIITLSGLVEESFNMMGLNINDKKEVIVLNEFFELMNDSVTLNIDLIDKFFEFED